MADQLEENKRNVVAFYDLMFNQGKPAEAVEKYVGDVYVQHNPGAADGKKAFIEHFMKMAAEYPGKCAQFKRVIAEGDLVVLHCVQHWPGDRDWAGIEIFRVDERGRIVEHWDELQMVPVRSTSSKTDVLSDSHRGEYMEKLSDEALDLLFREARTPNVWLNRAISDDTLRQLYNLAKWGPTSANTGPARFIFIRSEKAKERLRPTLSPGNVAKTMSAPVTVIIAYDLRFYDKLPKLFPNNPAMRDVFANNPQLIEATAKRNSSLQGAYLILAARALGLDCGPMSGFDNAKVDEEFFAAGRCEECEQEFFPEGHVKSNFLCNIGYSDRAQLSPRNPRLEFTEACTLL